MQNCIMCRKKRRVRISGQLQLYWLCH